MIRGKLVQVVSGEDEREFILEKQTVTLGRGLDNDVVLPNPEISRHHARLVFQPDPMIEDAGSTLGTIVGGEKITASHPLHSGDIITIGDLHLRFEFAASGRNCSAPSCQCGGSCPSGITAGCPQGSPNPHTGLISIVRDSSVSSMSTLFRH